MNQEEAKNIFQKYFGDRNLRMNYEDAFTWLEKNSDLIYLQDGRFGFRHRTIMEFFYAKSFSEMELDGLNEKMFDVQWVTIVFFFVGLRKDCPELLNKISAVSPTTEYGIFMKIVNMANILLAGYTSPYKHTEEILCKTFTEAAKYVDDVIGGRKKTNAFKAFSTMSFLCLFRIIMDMEYSRPFFKKAIKNSLLTTEEENFDNQSVKALTLFLLNISHSTLGGEDIFSGMIEKMKNQIPGYVRLAINHETDRMKNLSPRIKRYKKSIKKTLLSKEQETGVFPMYHKKLELIKPNDSGANS